MIFDCFYVANIFGFADNIITQERRWSDLKTNLCEVTDT